MFFMKYFDIFSKTLEKKICKNKTRNYFLLRNKANNLIFVIQILDI